MAWIKALNNSKEKTRVANGKPAKIHNTSMNLKYTSGGSDEVDANGRRLGDQAFEDMTDKENDEASLMTPCSIPG